VGKRESLSTRPLQSLFLILFLPPKFPQVVICVRLTVGVDVVGDDVVGIDVVGLDVVGVDVVGRLELVGLDVVGGLELDGLDVVGLSDVGLDVGGIDVVGLDVEGKDPKTVDSPFCQILSPDAITLPLTLSW